MKQLILMSCLIFSMIASGQSKKAQKSFDKAKTSLKAQQIEATLMHLDKAIEIEPEYMEAWSMRGDVYFSLEEYLKASESYSNAVSFGARNHVKYKLAFSQMLAEEYEEAEKTFLSYLEYGNIRPETEQKVKRFIANCSFAKEAIKHPVPFDVKSMGNGVNTEMHQYHPSISIDGKVLIYTQSDPKITPSEDFYYTINEDGVWTEGKLLPGVLNTSLNEGVQALTADGKTMYFTICHRQDGKGSCDIYRSELMENGMWSRGINLGDSINSPQWETQPTVSSDGKTLYFVRAKRSNANSSAILVAHLREDGKWSKAKSVSNNINTPYREASPFIHFDNRTMYFASDGHPGMGKKDIYVVRKDDNGEWGEPENIGYPINTNQEEFGLTVSSDGRRAFFASDRLSGEDKDLNIYYFDLPMDKTARPVAWIKGTIKDEKTKKPISSEITLIDVNTGVEASVVQSNEQGEYFAVVPANASYAINVDEKGYLLYSDNLTVENHSFEEAFRKNVDLSPIERGEHLVLNNIFFDVDSYQLKEASNVELEKLLVFLNRNPQLKISIDGHTDNEGSKSHNQLLSENRAKAVKDYLIQNGIEVHRLKSRGYGDSKPIASNNTEKGRASNRRTEITIL